MSRYRRPLLALCCLLPVCAVSSELHPVWVTALANALDTPTGNPEYRKDREDIPPGEIKDGVTLLFCEPTNAVHLLHGEKQSLPGVWQRCIVADLTNECFTWFAMDFTESAEELVQTRKTIGVQHIYRVSPWLCPAGVQPRPAPKAPGTIKFLKLEEHD